MSTYTLNDIAFNPEPLTLFDGKVDGSVDIDSLNEGFEKNRQIIAQFRKEYKYYEDKVSKSQTYSE